MTPYRRFLGNVAFEDENRERRPNTILLALCLVAMGCNIRRMLDMPGATHEDNETMLREMKRWQDDLTW